MTIDFVINRILFVSSLLVLAARESQDVTRAGRTAADQQYDGGPHEHADIRYAVPTYSFPVARNSNGTPPTS